jgi:2-keto-4-pentenoate hydratase/2-oxohepta-3-ene-1,7-dioic acid hydratase in catechol pathway
MGMPNKPWLKKGDVVEVEVEKLGKLTNTMA